MLYGDEFLGGVEKLGSVFVAWMGSSRRANPSLSLCGLLVVTLFLYRNHFFNSMIGQRWQFALGTPLVRMYHDRLFRCSKGVNHGSARGERRADLGETGGGRGERKIIYNAGLTLETRDPDGVYAFVMEYIKEQERVCDSSRRWVDRDERLHIQMQLRFLPALALKRLFGPLAVWEKVYRRVPDW